MVCHLARLNIHADAQPSFGGRGGWVPFLSGALPENLLLVEIVISRLITHLKRVLDNAVAAAAAVATATATVAPRAK